jgi:hypothetical protein
VKCVSCFLPITNKESHCSLCNGTLHKDCAIKENDTIYCDVCYTVKREEQPTIAIPDVIRRSHIELYKMCPFKFYQEVLNNNPQPTNIYAQLGIDLHTLFDKASQDKQFTYPQMSEAYVKIFDKYEPELFTEVSQKKMFLRGQNCIESFYNILPHLPATPHATEETIQFSIGEDLPIVQTTSDRIDLVDGKLEVLDWKTGKVMVGKKISSDLQAPLYIYGIRNKYKMPIRKFTFYYLDENKIRVFNQINNDEYECCVRKRSYYINIMDAIREVKSIFSHIKKGNFNVPRNIKDMYFYCKYCHIREQKICEGADLQGWKQYNKKEGVW